MFLLGTAPIFSSKLWLQSRREGELLPCIARSIDLGQWTRCFMIVKC